MMTIVKDHLVPEGWTQEKFESCVVLPAKLKGVKKTDYKTSGAFPIFDQAQTYISGFTDQKELLNTSYPAILFGDHTRILKFITQPFVLGADGTKVFWPKRGINASFLYQALLRVNIPNTGYNRHFKWLKESTLILPPVPEQERIAGILASVDDEIQKTDEIIAATEKLKRGLMQRLFTRGNGHLNFKKTEFGEIPQEWEVVKLPQAVDFQEGPGILAKDFRSSGVPLVRLEGLSSNSLLQGCNYLDPELVAKKWEHFRLLDSDVLLSSSASLGRVAVVEREGVGAIVYTGIIRFRPLSGQILNMFIKWFLLSPIFEQQIVNRGTGSTIKHFGPSHLKEIYIVVPKPEEQQKIVDILSAVDEQITINQKLKDRLVLLKKGLTQDLLSGNKRFV